MSDKAWKTFELQVAKMFGTSRRLRRGSDEVADIGDDDFPFIVDAKVHKQLKVWQWMDNLVQKAEEKGKPPIVILRQARKHTKYAICQSKWFFDTFDSYITQFSLFCYKKATYTFLNAFAASEKMSGDNKIAGLFMKGDGRTYVSIRAEHLVIMMRNLKLIGGEDEE